MLRLISALLLGIFLCVSGAAASRPLEFKGLHIGSTVAELLAKYPQLSCSDPKQKVVEFRNDPNFLKFWERKQDEADLFCGTVFGGDERDIALAETAGHRAEAIDINFFEGRLAYAKLSLPSLAFDDLLAALTAKYGPPTRQDIKQVQNMAGAVFNNVFAYWDSNDGFISLIQYAGSLDKSEYELTSNTYWPEVEKRRAARAKDAAKSL